MLAYWDRDLRCRFANRAYATWFGVDPDSLIGTRCAICSARSSMRSTSPTSRGSACWPAAGVRARDSGPGDEAPQPGDLCAEIVDGEVMGFIAHVSDVTRLKETGRRPCARDHPARACLHAAAPTIEMLRDAQRIGHVGSWEWEVAPDITIWSDELYRIFGATQAPRRPPSPSTRRCTRPKAGTGCRPRWRTPCAPASPTRWN